MECTVCLDVKPLYSHCDRCEIQTCHDCYEKLLGLCCICDRLIISTPIPCYICGKSYPIFEIEDVDASMFYICKRCSYETDSDPAQAYFDFGE